MKTIKEWLQELPEPYKTKTLYYRENASTLFKDNKYARSHGDALDNAFEWSKTEEGEQYWEDLSINLHTRVIIPIPLNAMTAIEAISLKLGFPAEDIIGIKPHTNAPHGKWEYMLKDTTTWIFIDLSNP